MSENNQQRKVLRSTDDSNRQSSSSNTNRRQQLNKPTNRLVNTKEKSIECKLINEQNTDDLDEENLILENVELTSEELKLKTKNKDLFWQKISEKIRSNLSETLEENQQLHEFKKAIEQDNKDLLKEQTKLAKLANEAGEICKSFLNQDNDDIDDSALNE